jgi:phosphatidylcholine synthase
MAVKNNLIIPLVSWQRRLAAWMVHILTASGAVLGILALFAIYQHRLLDSFWLMGAAILIDAVDGLLARIANVQIAAPKIDGALLDNIVDFLNYTIVPAFFLLVTTLLPADWRKVCVASVIFASAYQFTQVDAKTADNFFKGFPSYWNIVVFYLYFWQMNAWANLIILFSLAILCFVPIKYVYPSRLDYLTHSYILRVAMLLATILWGVATVGLLRSYPETNLLLVIVSMGYLGLYGAVSLYRTWVPLLPKTS